MTRPAPVRPRAVAAVTSLHTRRPWSALPLAAAALTTLALAACRTPDAAARTPAGDGAERPAIAVRVARVTTADRPASLTVAATLAAKEELALAFTIGGVLARVPVEPGMRVTAGQVLAELTEDEIGAAVRKAREGREKAERDFARAQALYADSAVTRAQLDDARTGLEVARADERAALFNRRFATIVAPADGIVLRRQGEAGEQVPPGRPVVVLRTARRGMVARVTLADHERSRVQVGDAADVAFTAAPGRVLAGTVQVLGAAPNPMTGAYDAEVALRGGDDLPSGLVGTAAIHPVRRRNAPAVPMVPVEALVEADGDSAAVFVIAPGDVARRRAVRVGPLVDGQVAVIRGVSAGDAVVVAGGAYLADGVRVRVTPGAERAP